jgi:hypothetical protein
MITTRFAHAGQILFGIGQKSMAATSRSLPGIGMTFGASGPRGQDDEIVIFAHQLGNLRSGFSLLQVDMRDDLANPLQLGRHHVLESGCWE